MVCDQFVDRTYARAQTFYDGPRVVHISTADPYCPELRALSVVVGRELGVTIHERGTVVVIQGPRFATRSESRWFSQQDMRPSETPRFVGDASLAKRLLGWSPAIAFEATLAEVLDDCRARVAAGLPT